MGVSFIEQTQSTKKEHKAHRTHDNYKNCWRLKQQSEFLSSCIVSLGFMCMTMAIGQRLSADNSSPAEKSICGCNNWESLRATRPSMGSVCQPRAALKHHDNALVHGGVLLTPPHPPC